MPIYADKIATLFIVLTVKSVFCILEVLCRIENIKKKIV